MFQRAKENLVTKFSSNHRPALHQTKSVMKFKKKMRCWVCRMHDKGEKIRKGISCSVGN
jgi:hypothetical protein